MTRGSDMRTMVMMLVVVVGWGLARAGDETFERTVAADPHGTVEITNISGRIEVSAWDNPQVQVHAEHAPAGQGNITVDSDHDRVTIKVLVPGASFGRGGTQLFVKVPRESGLEVSAVSADVSTRDVQGPQQLKVVSGEIKADAFQKDVEAKSFSGDVIIQARNPGAHLRLSSISGEIKVEHGAADLEATNVSGDVLLHLDSMHNLRVHTTSSDVVVEGKLLHGGSIDADTVSGEMKLRVIPDKGFDYDISTFSGDIDNCMGAKAESVHRYGPGSRLHGSVGPEGSNDAQIRVKSMSGSVRLCDKP